MNWKKFVSANLFFLGTVIIVSGFIWMITQSIVEVSFEQTLIAFCYTVSGIIFWGVGMHLNPDAKPFSKPPAFSHHHHHKDENQTHVKN